MSFEDELGEALRRAGDGFTADRHALVEAGERRGRRLVARRRASVIGGSVLSLALIGTAGAYAGGLLGGADRVEIATPPMPSGGPSGGGGDGIPEPLPQPPRGTGAVSSSQMVEVLKGLLPEGTLSVERANGTDGSAGAGVRGVYDDGQGGAGISLVVTRVDPNGSMANTTTLCTKKATRPDDNCTTEQLADGSKLLIQQGYAAQNHDIDIKEWRAALVTPQGFLVELSAQNALPMETTKASRPNPPLSPAQLRAVVISDKWHPALNDLPAAPQQRQGWTPANPNALRDLKAVEQLEKMVTRMKVPVISKGGESRSGYVVVDDGKGKSLVRLDVVKETGAPDFEGNVPSPNDGIRTKVTQGPAEKGSGVAAWTVDTRYRNGLRVTVTAYNAADQSGKATRETPALTLELLQQITTDPMWFELDHFASA
ncbi:hypothetical protein ACFWP3_03070 [Streptomyces sp. NPDC058525]|uniref:hypothetical protein n=1 Tax=Streptomyces sp. NPDC058525 TaxID=3346538 RepID=UPI00364DCC84